MIDWHPTEPDHPETRADDAMLKASSNHLKSRGLTGPALLVDAARARANIRAMADKARRSEVAFRPHFKSHQSPVVGRWFADEGVAGITVSSVDMAERFAASGWRDITIAFLLNPLEMPRIRDLAAALGRRGGKLGLTVDSVAAARAAAAPGIDVWVKVDTGYGRTGVPWDAPHALNEVLAAAGRPVGLLTHAGHSYAVRGGAGLTELLDATVARLAAARRDAGRPDLKLSLGDTPCCSAAARFTTIDEIRPGNFVYYDLMQLQIGSCTEAQVAAAAVCPVVGIYPERKRIVLHGGAVHLSKESLVRQDGRHIYGQLGALAFDPRSPQGPPAGLGACLTDAPVVALSQEHGIVEVAGDFRTVAGDLEIGDLVAVWPVHSCLTAHLLPDIVLI